MDAITKLADEIAMEWKNVPCMPSGRLYDQAWRSIILRAREQHGKEAVTKALSIVGRRYSGTVPTDEPRS